ncbi:MAG TPA: hypothetical protein VG737_09515 [Cyclobacteriaceae bacterium]|nr:hypothetical protein [Cyclobacteriaceae bacterium]
MKTKKILSVILRLVAAGIMLQTLYFKFTAQPESVYIFSQVGIEPWGRIGTGVAELIASALLLYRGTVVPGAIMAIGIMLGAVATHLLILGIQVQGDHGQLFTYAMIVLISAVALLYIHAEELALLKARFLKR